MIVFSPKNTESKLSPPDISRYLYCKVIQIKTSSAPSIMNLRSTFPCRESFIEEIFSFKTFDFYLHGQSIAKKSGGPMSSQQKMINIVSKFVMK